MFPHTKTWFVPHSDNCEDIISGINRLMTPILQLPTDDDRCPQDCSGKIYKVIVETLQLLSIYKDMHQWH